MSLPGGVPRGGSRIVIDPDEPWRQGAAVQAIETTRSERATSLELFFDLTFVFTVTQLTSRPR